MANKSNNKSKSNNRDSNNIALVTKTDNRPSTGRGGKYNFPNAQPPADPDDVRAALTPVLYWYQAGLQPANTDEEIEQRTQEYILHCIETGERPTVECYCLAIGHPRATVNDWRTGRHTITPRRASIIKKAFDTIAAYDAQMVSVGKLRDTPYIFRAKNYYDMRDEQEIVITPHNPLGDEISAEDIAAKYAELPD